MPSFIIRVVEGKEILVPEADFIAAIGAGFPIVFKTNADLVVSNVLMAKRFTVINSNSLESVVLPETSAVGDRIMLSAAGSANWSLSQAAGQSIVFGDLETALGVTGGISSTDPSDVLELVCLEANTRWKVINSQGNFDVNANY